MCDRDRVGLDRDGFSAGSNRIEALLTLVPSVSSSWPQSRTGDDRCEASGVTITAPNAGGTIVEAVPAAVSVFLPADATDRQLVQTEASYPMDRAAR